MKMTLKTVVATVLLAVIVSGSAFAQSDPTEAITFGTTRSFYESGEPVVVRLHVNSETPVYLWYGDETNNAAVNFYRDNPRFENAVYSLGIVPSGERTEHEQILSKGSTHDFVWDQRSDSGRRVSPGKYGAYILYTIGAHGPSRLAKCEFEVVPRSAGRFVVRTTRSSYRSDENIVWYVINKSKADLILNSGTVPVVQVKTPSGKFVTISELQLPEQVAIPAIGGNNRRMFCIDKKNTTPFNNRLAPGEYRISVSTWMASGPPLQVFRTEIGTAYFRIVGSNPARQQKQQR